MNTTEADKQKSNYLYAFEDLFRAKCAAAGIKAGDWKMGMWTNAHMYYGMGVGTEDAVARWFTHVESVEKKMKKKAKKSLAN